MNRTQSALHFISPEQRSVWVSMGMALKSEYGDAACDMWMDWSRQADSFREADARAVWRSFRGTGISIGSLIHEAKLSGFKDDDKFAKPTQQQLRERQEAAAERLTRDGVEREQRHVASAKKAAWVMHQTKPEQHAYLDSKGWPDALGAVWWATEEQNLLCIPMRVGDALVGVQLIDRNGTKRYLKGQRTSEAEYLISNNGRGAMDWFCEGYATGLSLRECLHALRMRYRIHITFSASNLVKVAALHSGGYVVADRDDSGTGERVAVQTGLPYFLPESGDFNDFSRSVGIFQASQALRKWLVSLPDALNASQTDQKSIPNGSQLG